MSISEIVETHFWGVFDMKTIERAAAKHGFDPDGLEVRAILPHAFEELSSGRSVEDLLDDYLKQMHDPATHAMAVRIAAGCKPDNS